MSRQSRGHDRRYRFSLACEFMLRAHFGRASRRGGVRSSQDAATARFLRYAGGEGAEAEYVRGELSIHSDRGVSAVWLSDAFTMPLFAALAHDFCCLLHPRGVAPFDVGVEADPDAFFGYRMTGVWARGEDPLAEHLLVASAAAATKSLLGKADAIRAAFDACKALAERA